MEVASVRADYDEAMAEAERLQVALHENQSTMADHDTFVENFEREKTNMRSRIKILELRLQDRGDSDNTMLVAVQEQVRELRSILDEKVAMLTEKDLEIADLKGEMARLVAEQEKENTVALRAEIAERDEQIRELASELDDAQRENEVMSEEIVKVNKRIKTEIADATVDIRRQLAEATELLHNTNEELEDEREHYATLDVHHSEVQQKLAKCQSRMTEYEHNLYGLDEAVAEIRDLERKIGIRDDDITRLHGHVTQRDKHVQTLYEENQALRLKAGVSPEEVIDLKELRIAQYVEMEQLRAQQAAYEEQVAMLEDDRVRMQKELVIYAKLLGQKAAAMGVNSEHLLLAQKLKEGYSQGDLRAEMSRKHLLPAPAPEPQAQQQGDPARQSWQPQQANLAAQQAMQQVAEQQMEMMKSLATEMQAQMRATQASLAVDRERAVDGRSTNDVAVLQVANMELKKQLEEAQIQHHEVEHQLADLRATMNVHQSQTSLFGHLSAEVQEARPLLEQVLKFIDELRSKDADVEALAAELVQCKNEVAEAASAQVLLYELHAKAEKEFAEQREAHLRELKDLQSQVAQADAKSDAFEKMAASMSASPTEQQQAIQEMTRQVAALRVNELELARRCKLAELAEKGLRTRLDRTQREHSDMERSVRDRVGYLQRCRRDLDVTASRLERELARSVPARDFMELNAKFCALQWEKARLVAQYSASEAHAPAPGVMNRTELEALALEVEKRLVESADHQLAGRDGSAAPNTTFGMLFADMDKDALLKRCAELEDHANRLETELEKYKIIADVASDQAQAVLAREEDRDTEMRGLRAMVSDLQVKGDHEAQVGRLAHEALQLRLSEAAAQRAVDERASSQATAETMRAKAEKLLDAKSRQLIQAQDEARRHGLLLKRGAAVAHQQQAGNVWISISELRLLVDTTRSADDSAVTAKQAAEQAKAAERTCREELSQLQVKVSSLQLTCNAQEAALQELREQNQQMQLESTTPLAAQLLAANSKQSGAKMDEALRLLAENQKSMTEDRTALGKALTDLDVAQRKIKYLEETIKQKDMLLLDLQAKLAEIPHPDAVLERGTNRALATVQATIQSMQAMLDKKDDDIKNYKRLLEECRLKLLEEHRAHSEQLADLSEQLNSGGDAALLKLNSQLAKIEHPAETSRAGMFKTLESAMGERDKQLSIITSQLETTQRELEMAREKLADRSDELARSKSESLSKEEPAKDQERTIRELKRLLKSKELEQVNLKKAVMTLKQELLEAAEQLADKEAASQTGSRADQHQRRLDVLQERFSTAQAELQAMREREFLFKKAASEKVDEIAKYREVAKKLQTRIEELETQVATKPAVRTASATAARRPSSAMATTREPPPAKPAPVQEPVAPKEPAVAPAAPAERPSTAPPAAAKKPKKVIEMATTGTNTTSSGAVEKWEVEKRMQHKVDSLKLKNTELTKQCEELRVKVTSLATAVQAAEKERELLKADLQEASRKEGGKRVKDLLVQIDDLTKRNYQLESEKIKYQRLAEVEREQEVKALQRERQLLIERLNEYEKGESRESRDPSELSAENEKLRAIMHVMQEEALTKDNTNMELRFDYEHAHLQIGRLQKRIVALEQHLEAVAGGRPVPIVPLNETQQHTGKPKSKEQELREMADVIEALKKVVQKQLKEIETLKKSSQSSLKFMDLLKENKTLKTQMDELQKQVAAKARDGGAVAELQRQLQKANTEIDKLRRQVKKEQENADKIRQVQSETAAERNRLQQDLASTTARADSLNRAADADSMRHNTAVESVVAQLEARIKQQDDELHKKTSAVQELRTQLQNTIRAATDAKQQLDLANRQAQLTNRSDISGGEGGADRSEVRVLQKRISELLKEKATLEQKFKAVRMSVGDVRSYRGKTYESLVRSHEQRLNENRELLAELNQFDPQFFEDLEDLKYNVREAQKKVETYETQLRKMSERFGFPFEPIRSAR
eukprot:TRINITY_DN1909_c0_g1_i1.p1 TRINITY_DN1909_c0_g1~~TRINITY_DN1909_c0_g1_i1.p1  ORF type:complete len:2137 (+),score=755.12 TRINITY_DN1909_c0_g1_i1:506-6412(+)